MDRLWEWRGKKFRFALMNLKSDIYISVFGLALHARCAREAQRAARDVPRSLWVSRCACAAPGCAARPTKNWQKVLFSALRPRCARPSQRVHQISLPIFLLLRCTRAARATRSVETRKLAVKRRKRKGKRKGKERVVSKSFNDKNLMFHPKLLFHTHIPPKQINIAR